MIKPPTIQLTDESLTIETETRRRLFEIGMVGATNGQKFEAFLFFGKLALAEPAEPYPLIGVAYCKIMSGQFLHAFQLLNHPVVQESPMKPYADALISLGLHLADQPCDLLPLDDSTLPTSVQELLEAVRE